MSSKLTFSIVEKNKTPEHHTQGVSLSSTEMVKTNLKLSSKSITAAKAVSSSSIESGEKRKILLQNWFKKTQMRRIMHTVTSRMLHRWHMFFGCAIMVLSAITGGAGMSLPQTNEELISYGMSGSSMIVAALSAIQHFCRFESRSTQHQHIAED